MIFLLSSDAQQYGIHILYALEIGVPSRGKSEVTQDVYDASAVICEFRL